jgi:hypothetical protein
VDSAACRFPRQGSRILYRTRCRCNRIKAWRDIGCIVSVVVEQEEGPLARDRPKTCTIHHLYLLVINTLDSLLETTRPHRALVIAKPTTSGCGPGEVLPILRAQNKSVHFRCRHTNLPTIDSLPLCPKGVYARRVFMPEGCKKNEPAAKRRKKGLQPFAPLSAGFPEFIPPCGVLKQSESTPLRGSAYLKLLCRQFLRCSAA